MKRFLNTVAGCAFAMSVSMATASSAEEVVLVSTGGAFGDALIENFFDPFTDETGIDVVFVQSGTIESMTSLQAQQQANNVEYDILAANPEILLTYGDNLQDLDCDQIPNAEANGLPGTCEGKRLVRTTGAMVVAYNTEAFPNGGPQNWADFFDVEKFPGRRCMMAANVESFNVYLLALLADGVAPEDLYPFDFDRAEAKLREIMPHIGGLYSSFSMSQQLMRDGECVVAVMVNGRALSLRNEGFPLAISWEQALTSVGVWTIAKGAPNEENAYKLLNFWMTRPEAHLAFYRTFFYGTDHKDVGGLMSEDDFALYHANPDNFSNLLPLNWAYLAENRDEISRRYTKLLAE